MFVFMDISNAKVTNEKLMSHYPEIQNECDYGK
jgi:hypothetical protein